MEEEKRKFIRVEYNIPIIVETADITIPSCDGILQDVSAQGVMFDVREKLYPGLPVRIHLKMKKDLAPLVGYIKWQKKQNDQYRIGIILDDSHCEQNDRVLEMVTQQIIDESRPSLRGVDESKKKEKN